MSGEASSTLFVGYRAFLAAQPGWALSFHQSRPRPNSTVIRRTIWTSGTNESRRLIVDVEEHLTSLDVKRSLELRMREAGVTYDSGSAVLGPRSLVYPDTKPWSIYVTRANLLIWGLSNGAEQLEVEPLLKPLLAELDGSRSHQLDQHLTFSREPDAQQMPGVIRLRFKPEWVLGEWAWLKFEATGAMLERGSDANTLAVLPTTPGSPIEVTGWVIEPGRKTYTGRYGATAG
jgi:hypothetical protein